MLSVVRIVLCEPRGSDAYGPLIIYGRVSVVIARISDRYLQRYFLELLFTTFLFILPCKLFMEVVSYVLGYSVPFFKFQISVFSIRKGTEIPFSLAILQDFNNSRN